MGIAVVPRAARSGPKSGPPNLEPRDSRTPSPDVNGSDKWPMTGDENNRCHNRRVNWLRDRLGRYWFRLIRLQITQEEPPRPGSVTRVA